MPTATTVRTGRVLIRVVLHDPRNPSHIDCAARQDSDGDVYYYNTIKPGGSSWCTLPAEEVGRVTWDAAE